MTRKIVTIICIAASVVIAGGSVVYSHVLRGRADAILAELESGEVPVAEDEGASDVDYGRMLSSASDAGRSVIELQQRFVDSMSALDGLEGEALDKALEDQRGIVDEMDVYFEEDAKNSCPWYDGNNYDVDCTWEMQDNYRFSKSSVDCLWLCKDGEGRILAYATSRFDGKDNLFGSVSVRSTSYGNSKMATTLRDGQTPEQVYDTPEVREQVDGILDAAKTNNVGPSRELTGEEAGDMADVYDARQQLMEEYQNGQEGGAE